MSTDEKTAFYLRHRALIEEWATLRDVARSLFITQLRGLGDQMISWADSPEAVFVEEDGAWSKVGLTKPAWNEAGWRLSLVLAWSKGQLLTPARIERPYVGIHLASGCIGRRARSQLLREECASAAGALGWKEPWEEAFPHWCWVDQPADSTTLEPWVDHCLMIFQAGWSALHGVLDEVVDN
ncbi:hypothetical protein [Geodermatophilus sabuli]|uniref:Uncharacterized protein n=1 Tax=Geodermatophilus sabuli TaxID=1564158 RepID=A0A285E6W5_9ACTN|nr:hypothetical protein [Geodermatophilus sabuli]MBB3082306.1 hypothetical protein [Geodermatophilus sabuli]SNX94822.1 hypothetical protein SAMN06893097_101619 [Geodermatophilus sabuli]